MEIPEFQLDRKIQIDFDKKNNLFYLNGIDSTGAYYSLFKQIDGVCNNEQVKSVKEPHVVQFKNNLKDKFSV